MSLYRVDAWAMISTVQRELLVPCHYRSSVEAKNVCNHRRRVLRMTPRREFAVSTRRVPCAIFYRVVVGFALQDIIIIFVVGEFVGE